MEANIKFRKADAEDGEAVLSMYKSVIGHPMCTWDEEYPGKAEIDHDTETGNLFLMEYGGKIAGAVSVVPENEFDSFPCWRVRDGANEIARVIINPLFQGRGLSRCLVAFVLGELKGRGCRSVHLAVAEINIPAGRTYTSLGFKRVGESDMFGSHYFLLEKII